MPTSTNSFWNRFKISAIFAAGLLACSCSSSDKGKDNGNPRPGSGVSKQASRMMDTNRKKVSMYQPDGDATESKSFKTDKFTSKEYKGKAYRGSKSYKPKSFKDGDQRSPWAGLTSRESAQEVTGDLTETYSTGSSRFAGKTSRDAGTNYGTGTYKTNDDIIGTKGVENSKPPKMIPNMNTKKGMTEGEIKALLGKQ